MSQRTADLLWAAAEAADLQKEHTNKVTARWPRAAASSTAQRQHKGRPEHTEGSDELEALQDTSASGDACIVTPNIPCL